LDFYILSFFWHRDNHNKNIVIKIGVGGGCAHAPSQKQGGLGIANLHIQNVIFLANGYLSLLTKRGSTKTS
jgi:hypothetical protein